MGVDPLKLNGYKFLSPIANGAFSQIIRALHLSSQREVAVKSYNKAKNILPANKHLALTMKCELDVLKQLQQSAHPNIAHLREVVEDQVSVHAILEYCSGGSLQRLLTKKNQGGNLSRSFGLDERLCETVAWQIASALSCMHGLGIAHRDLKPDNILFFDHTHSRVKICDFGFAVACGERKVRTMVGTPTYMAPEICGAGLTRRETYHAAPCDIWAFGAIVYEMLEGKPAFRAQSLEQLTLRVSRVAHQAFTEASPPASQDLTKRCLQLEPSSRLTAGAALDHPYFVETRAILSAVAAGD